jgi:hypothetical protein
MAFPFTYHGSFKIPVDPPDIEIAKRYLQAVSEKLDEAGARKIKIVNSTLSFIGDSWFIRLSPLFIDKGSITATISSGAIIVEWELSYTSIVVTSLIVGALLFIGFGKIIAFFACMPMFAVEAVYSFLAFKKCLRQRS